jgi:hypothetical protein
MDVAETLNVEVEVEVEVVGGLMRKTLNDGCGAVPA